MKFPWYVPVFIALLEGTDLPLQAKYDLKDDPSHVYLKMLDPYKSWGGVP